MAHQETPLSRSVAASLRHLLFVRRTRSPRPQKERKMSSVKKTLAAHFRKMNLESNVDGRTEEWWLSDYETEIYEHLLLRELKRPIYNCQSPQINYRRSIVEWIIAICDKKGLSDHVCHLAVFFLDYFMDHHHIEDEQLKLVSLGCILVAAKVDERDDLIPTCVYLNKIVDQCYELSDFTKMELAIMDFFQWDLLHPTLVQFADYYSIAAVFPTDRHKGQPIQSVSELWTSANYYIKYFQDASLLDTVFRRFRPSLIAASCIACMRICLHLSPTWPLALQKLTRYNSEHLMTCIELMLRILEADEKAAKEDFCDDPDKKQDIKRLRDVRTDPTTFVVISKDDSAEK